MERAMRAASAGTVDTPPRIIEPLAPDSGFFILMPGAMQDPAVYGAKIVGLHPGNPAQGLSAVQGFVSLFDYHSGIPLALMDGAVITAIRTAAASALATRELSRPDSSSHGIFGTGVQAGTHLRAIACVRGIREVRVWGRNPATAQQFARDHSESNGPNVIVVRDPADAAACDIVSLVTNAPEPVLKGAWLKPGAHLNLVGAHEPHDREADSDAVTQSAVSVDSRQGALSESGDILIPVSEGRMSENDIIGEIGEVLNGTAPGRLDGQQITLYKSLGIVAQDLFAAEHVYRNAQAQGLGLAVELS
jgi:ornithine cyclodeaminase